MSIPVVIYAAKSTDDVHGSIPTQVSDCEDAVKAESGRDVLGIYTDEAMSGFKGNRGQGLADAKIAAAKAAAGWQPGDEPKAEIWVQHSDRLARGDGQAADHLLEIHFAMKRAGVRLRSVQDDSLLQNVVTVAVAGEQNTGYSKRLKDAVTSGKDRQFAKGQRLGGPVVDGLRLIVKRDAADNVVSRDYVIDDARIGIIREIFALSEAGHGDAAIASKLNKAGHRTQQGRAWSRRRIQDTLTNQTYAGRVVRNRGKANETFTAATNVETIIEPERFDRIRNNRKTRDRSASGRPRGGRPTGRYALSQLATCAKCGATMYCVTAPYKRKDGTQQRSYICSNVKAQTGLCDAPKVDAERVDAAIVPHITGFFDDYASWATSVTQTTQTQRTTLKAEIDALKTKSAAATTAEQKAQDRYADALAADDGKAEALLGVLDRLGRQRREAERALEAREAALGALAAAAEPSDAMVTFWREVAEGIKGKISDATAMADVNAELRVALQRVEIETRPDGSHALTAIYRHKGNWEYVGVPVLDEDGKIPADPDYAPDFDRPEFVPDQVVIYSLSETGNDTQEAFLVSLRMPTLELPRPSSLR